MNKNDEIKALLNEKLSLFCQYEEQTRALINASEECIDNYITKRDELANSIDVLSHKIVAELEKNDNSFANAAYCKGNYSDYNKEEAEINHLATQIYGCINRVAELNTLFSESLLAQRAVVMEKIKQSKNTPKIKKYLGALSSQQGESILSGNV